MKRLALPLFLFILVHEIAIGQSGETSISDLQTPVSPGFVLADQTPSSINRPTNPKGLVASILSLNRGGALEVTPYWLSPIKYRATLTFDKYIDNNFPIAQTFSISATTFKSDTGSYLSVGGRLHLVRFYNKKEVQALKKKLVDLLSVDPDKLDLKAIEEARDQLGSIRPKFLVEIAGAWLGYTQLNTFDEVGKARTGIWGNILYKPAQSINIVGLARYINNKKQDNFSQNAEYLDIGASIGVESEKSDFSLNGEFVYRNNYLTKESTHRLAIIANYRLTNEFYLVGSFGKNFGEVNNLIALLGINIGLNNKPILIK